MIWRGCAILFEFCAQVLCRGGGKANCKPVLQGVANFHIPARKAAEREEQLADWILDPTFGALYVRHNA